MRKSYGMLTSISITQAIQIFRSKSLAFIDEWGWEHRGTPKRSAHNKRARGYPSPKSMSHCFFFPKLFCRFAKFASFLLNFPRVLSFSPVCPPSWTMYRCSEVFVKIFQILACLIWIMSLSPDPEAHRLRHIMRYVPEVKWAKTNYCFLSDGSLLIIRIPAPKT